MERSARLDMHGYRSAIEGKPGSHLLTPEKEPSSAKCPDTCWATFSEQSWLNLLNPEILYVAPYRIEYAGRVLIARARLEPPLHESLYYENRATTVYGEAMHTLPSVRRFADMWDALYMKPIIARTVFCLQ